MAMTERRYSDEEMAAIFGAAAEAPGTLPPHASSSSNQGLTLADLQAIGREVGIAPDAVARAAQALEVRRNAVSRRLLGLPIGVERRVTLSRRMTDDEWEQLVGELRDVFHARGRTKAEGSLRQWTNGNLYVLLEPTATGQRIRLGSLHGGAAASIRLGLIGLGTAALLALASAFGADVGNAIPALLVGGAVLLANGALRVPGWARLRARQMEDLAVRLAIPGESATTDV
jgi:hypothetical protein